MVEAPAGGVVFTANVDGHVGPSDERQVSRSRQRNLCSGKDAQQGIGEDFVGVKWPRVSDDAHQLTPYRERAPPGRLLISSLRLRGATWRARNAKMSQVNRTRALVASVALALATCTPTGEKQQVPTPPAPLAPGERSDRVVTPTEVKGPLRFLAIGGGPSPESTEVSLEQDIELVRRALPPPGVVLFAGGTRSESVRELDPGLEGDPVLLALGDLFAPRAGRGSRYRAPRFSAERATLENVEALLSSALAAGDVPLIVHIAAHGDQGPDARSNSVALWGGHSLTVARLAELHERHQRALRLVATSCFSGGFAELVFAHADPNAGPSSVPRCGLFAGTSDRKTSGCDPNPDRRMQDSYSLHFAHALSGLQRDGTALPAGSADYDQDGKIGLLDAHTWARIQAVSFDVPTTTSERWLRSVGTGLAPIDTAFLPEDSAVIEQLGKALALEDEAAVAKRWAELDQRLERLSDKLDEAEQALAERAADQATSVLERWPVLDDPFHPGFALSFQQNRGALSAALTGSTQARARAEAGERVQWLNNEFDRVGLEEARVLRLSRAYETLHRASALMKKGGPQAKYYSSLVACERAVP